jgi:hypothetical protein
MIVPTIGRVVWYWPNRIEDHICVGGDQALPALVCHVWSDTCINIAGFDANGIPFNRTSVLLVQDGNARPDQHFAEWMPYQKGQAAKTEAAEAAKAEKP